MNSMCVLLVLAITNTFVYTTAAKATATTLTDELNNKGRSLLGLEEFWNLKDPLWEYGGNEFELRYLFNNQVEDSMISYTFYDKNCQAGNEIVPMVGTGYEFEITNDGTPIGDGSSTRGYKVKFKPTSSINQNPIIYGGDYQDDNGNVFAMVEVCARVSLSTPNGIEVNFLESIMAVKYVFTDGFLVIDDITVRPPLFDLTNIELGVKLRAYDCTNSPDGTLSQGMVVRVCIEPVPEAIADGFRMKAIEWFTYSKMGANVTQESVVNAIQAPNELTRLICQQGAVECSVETMLVSAFFSGTGTVEAAGLATMQLGTHSSDTTQRRSLLRGDNRMLQEVLPETISKEFDIPFEVIPSSDQDGEGNGDTSSNVFWSLSESNNNGLNSVSVLIITLIVLNVLTLFVLVSQHRFFKRTWFYLS